QWHFNVAPAHLKRKEPFKLCSAKDCMWPVCLFIIVIQVQNCESSLLCRSPQFYGFHITVKPDVDRESVSRFLYSQKIPKPTTRRQRRGLCRSKLIEANEDRTPHMAGESTQRLNSQAFSS